MFRGPLVVLMVWKIGDHCSRSFVSANCASWRSWNTSVRRIIIASFLRLVSADFPRDLRNSSFQRKVTKARNNSCRANPYRFVCFGEDLALTACQRGTFFYFCHRHSCGRLFTSVTEFVCSVSRWLRRVSCPCACSVSQVRCLEVKWVCVPTCVCLCISYLLFRDNWKSC